MGVYSLRLDTTRVRRHREGGREEGVPGRFRGRVCGMQYGKMLPRKGCKCTGYPLGFESAFAMHSMRALKRRRAVRAGVLFAGYLPRFRAILPAKTPETRRGHYAHLLW